MKTLFFETVGTASLIFAACSGITACNDTDEPSRPLPGIIIVTDNVTENSVTATFAPGENAASFEAAIGSSGDRAAFESGTLEYRRVFSGSAPAQATFGNLEPDTEYTVFARARNTSGTPGETAVKRVRTTVNPEIPVGKVKIDVAAVTPVSVSVEFTPPAKAETFCFAIGKASDLANFEQGTLEGTIEAPAASNVVHIFENLESCMTYTIFARAYSGNRSGTVSTFAVEIPPAPEVKAEITRLNNISMNVKLIPNKSTPYYYYTVTTKTQFESDYEYYVTYGGWTEQEYMEVDGIYANSEVELFEMCTWKEGDEMTIAIATYYKDDNQVIFYGIDRNIITTPGIVDASAPRPGPIVVTVAEPTPQYDIHVTFTPGDNTVGYGYCVLLDSDYEPIINNDTLTPEEKINRLIEEHFKWNYVGQGILTETWHLEAPGQKFYAIALPYNENGIYGLGELIGEGFVPAFGP